MKTVQQLGQEIAKWDANLGRLQDSLGASQTRVAKLQADRKPCALAARIDKDAAAQEKLRQIDAEVTTLGVGIRDDQDAISHAQQKLKALRAELAVAEEEALRGGVKELIRARIAARLEGRIADAVKQLKAEIEKLLASNREIAAAMRTLHPDAAHSVGRAAELTDSQELIWNHIGYELRPLLPTGLGFRTPALTVASEYAGRLLSCAEHFQTLLAAIDLPSRAEGTETEEPSVVAAD